MDGERYAVDGCRVRRAERYGKRGAEVEYREIAFLGRQVPAERGAGCGQHAAEPDRRAAERARYSGCDRDARPGRPGPGVVGAARVYGHVGIDLSRGCPHAVTDASARDVSPRADQYAGTDRGLPDQWLPRRRVPGQRRPDSDGGPVAAGPQLAKSVRSAVLAPAGPARAGSPVPAPPATVTAAR